MLSPQGAVSVLRRPLLKSESGAPGWDALLPALSHANHGCVCFQNSVYCLRMCWKKAKGAITNPVVNLS